MAAAAETGTETAAAGTVSEPIVRLAVCEIAVPVFSPDLTPDLRRAGSMASMPDFRPVSRRQIKITTAVIIDVKIDAAV